MVLFFGSFWSGIKAVEIDARTGKPGPDVKVQPIAQRPEPPDALEAPFVIHRGKDFYLFVSFDACCQGTKSTYNIRVGRSSKIEGPYVDKEGKPLLQGGGTPVLATQGNQVGPGHCAVLREGNRYLLAYHFYDGDANGIPTLQVRPLAWTKDGWPMPEEPLK
jgi:arabinan endo-1,5-alpha-L-arabinosidase